MLLFGGVPFRPTRPARPLDAATDEPRASTNDLLFGCVATTYTTKLQIRQAFFCKKIQKIVDGKNEDAAPLAG